MNNSIACERSPIYQNHMKLHAAVFIDTIRKHGTHFLITVMFTMGTLIALIANVPVKEVMNAYSYDVLVILIAMELFTNLIAETGVMQLLALKIANFSQGKKRLCLMMFGGMMFIISAFLNNITAVMMILPLVFVLLKALGVERHYICTFFAVILALSNTGGAASPIGDFPAIVIMTSGITSFLGYLSHAFPLFTATSAVLLLVYGMSVTKEADDESVRALAISNLGSQYKNIVVRFDVLKWLGIIFAGMFCSWSVIPQNLIPPEIIAVIGYVISVFICAMKGVNVKQSMDLKSVLTIASFLFFAQVVSQTGVLNLLATHLQNHISNPKLLVMAIMIITSLVAGIFSAGPAAAAMMPVVVEICHGPLSAQADWISVAYAAAICAGSSLFMWSATAGFILSEKVGAAKIEDEAGDLTSWGVGEYLKYGAKNYIIQLTVALVVIMFVL